MCCCFVFVLSQKFEYPFIRFHTRMYLKQKKSRTVIDKELFLVTASNLFNVTNTLTLCYLLEI